MTERYRALTGLRYPDGDAEYEKAIAGEPYKERTIEAGDEVVNLPEKSLAAYLAMGRPILEPMKAKPKKVDA